MTAFDESNWAKPEFAQGYRENADIYVLERRRMLSILQSFYLHFLKGNSSKTMLDLGCGDGILTSAIAEVDDAITATLVDGSADMLRKAEERLIGLKNARFVRAGFEEIVSEDSIDGNYDLIATSLAIHHLTLDGKKSIFRYVHDHLNPGGYFVNIDVVLAPHETLEQWYASLWREWIDERTRVLRIQREDFVSVVDRYKRNKDNKPDTLEAQLEGLMDAGFSEVDCYYKYGIFAMFGGRKGLSVE
jgi:tRNA (cmo5U34)-methyltransferase